MAAIIAKYPREKLLASKRYAGYQPDFLRVLLSKDEYTLQEADRIVKAFFDADKSETKGSDE